MKRCKTVPQVFDVLGGDDKVAKIAKAKRAKQAWHWRKTEQFPANTYVPVQRALRRRGYHADDTLFSMKGVGRAA